jgi:hypothetical protein
MLLVSSVLGEEPLVVLTFLNVALIFIKCSHKLREKGWKFHVLAYSCWEMLSKALG